MRKFLRFGVEILVHFLFGNRDCVEWFTLILLHSPLCLKCDCTVPCRAERRDKDNGIIFYSAVVKEGHWYIGNFCSFFTYVLQIYIFRVFYHPEHK